MFKGILPTGTSLHDVAAWWDFKFDAVFDDRGLNSNTLSNTDATFVDTNIHDGKYYSYNGTTSLLEAADSTSINVGTLAAGDGFSLEVWVNAGSDGENNGAKIIDKADGTNSTTFDGYSMNVEGESGGNLQVTFAVGQATTNARSISTSADVSIDIWHHIVGTYRDSATLIYVDGVLETTTNTAGDGAVDADTSVLRVGNHSLAASRTFDGFIGPIRIWNKQLTADQVGQIYNKFKDS